MRLPLAKIAWGTFAFPWMYRGEFARALSLPLLGLLACTMASNVEAVTAGPANYVITALYLLSFAWLAIRCHRLVLTGSHRMDEFPPRALGVLGLFTVTVVMLWIVQSLVTLLLASGTIAATSAQYVEAGTPAPPSYDPDFQLLIDRVVFFAGIVALYPVARLSPLLPALAIGVNWNAAGAWRLSRRNGWRLVFLVFLVPALFENLIEWSRSDDLGAVAFTIVVLLLGVVTSLGVVALSLSYRELTTPGPSPTPPPA